MEPNPLKWEKAMTISIPIYKVDDNKHILITISSHYSWDIVMSIHSLQYPNLYYSGSLLSTRLDFAFC